MSTLDPEAATLDEVVPAGEPWMGMVRKGQHLRIVNAYNPTPIRLMVWDAAGATC
jgi:hypothetical protein